MKKTKGIYWRGNVLWIRYAGLDGKMIFESAQTDKMKKAEDLLHKRKAAIASGKMPEITKRIENHSFGELCDEYLKWAERQRSYFQKTYIIKQLRERFGAIPLRRFDTRIVEQFQTERISIKNKPATCNRLVGTLKHMFTKAYDWNWTDEETLKRIRKVKLLEERNRRLRYLSPQETRSLIAACSDHVRPIVTVLLNTGMRKSEVLALTWEQVDLRNGLILLHDTKNADRREVPINETVRRVLSGIVRRVDIPWVFYNPQTDGRYNSIWKSFDHACKKAKIRDFHVHDCRHAFASALVMSGADLVTVKELLGHRDIKMTLRYAHLAPSHRSKAVEMLDQVLQGDYTKTVQFSEK